MTKITLSPFEATLVNNSEWILTKHTIIHKAGELLAAQVAIINNEFTGRVKQTLPQLAACQPRISKGERYRDLPYVILDYPAIFSKTDVFAVRTMFWWGNFFSVTLHLSGTYKKMFEEMIQANLTENPGGYYISIADDEWEHHFGTDNYCNTAGLDKETLHKKIVQPSFIKIALQYDLRKWDEMDELLQQAYCRFAGLLTA